MDYTHITYLKRTLYQGKKITQPELKRKSCISGALSRTANQPQELHEHFFGCSSHKSKFNLKLLPLTIFLSIGTLVGILI